MIIEKIKALANQYFSEAVEIRRYHRQNPCLSYHEEATVKAIVEKLNQWEIPHKVILNGTGVLVEIVGKAAPDNGKCVLLRSDIDALPITQAENTRFPSKKPGVMNACGHDSHLTMALLASRYLNLLSGEFSNRVKILFQPAEESVTIHPETGEPRSGATMSIHEAKVLENPSPSCAIALHCDPIRTPVGKIRLRQGGGGVMAGVDEIEIIIKSPSGGGHAAMPHNSPDVVATAGQMLVSLQQVVSRLAPPTLPTVLTFSQINSESKAFNVMGSSCRLVATLRSYDNNWRHEAHRHIERIAKSVAAAFQTEAQVTIKKYTPYLNNDELLTNRVIQHAIEYLGKENVLTHDEPAMTGEDFAFFSHELPTCFYWLGVANPVNGLGMHPLHSNQFDIDEECLLYGSGLMAYLALRELKI